MNPWKILGVCQQHNVMLLIDKNSKYSNRMYRKEVCLLFNYNYPVIRVTKKTSSSPKRDTRKRLLTLKKKKKRQQK